MFKRDLIAELQAEISLVEQARPAMGTRSFEERHLLNSLKIIYDIFSNHDERLQQLEFAMIEMQSNQNR